jgi:hypothetical protein
MVGSALGQHLAAEEGDLSEPSTAPRAEEERKKLFFQIGKHEEE